MIIKKSFLTEELILLIKEQTSLSNKAIKNIISLIDDGCTIPFIARYRKDETENAKDEDLRAFEEVFNYSKKLLKRKEEIANILNEKNFLNDKINTSIKLAKTIQVLEDIYAPFKDKKSSRTSDAIDNGLEPLANIIQSLKYTNEEVKQKAKQFINTKIKSNSDAISGAKDIIAQRYADDFKSKEIVRNIIASWGELQIKEGKEFEKNGLYSSFIEKKEKIKYIKSHRILAILRAVNEKELSIKIEIDENHILENIKKYKIPQKAESSRHIVFESYKDGLKRLLLPSLKREALNTLKEKASGEAIELFGKNLKELLLTAPLVNQVILGMDPGFVSGCKLAVIDENGIYLDSSVIYPTKPKEDIENSSKTSISFNQEI